MKHFFLATLLLLATFSFAQNKTRALKMEEYEKAKLFTIKDLDNDSYVKFENKYILDRYENRKPYFVTGDDGNKKRFDIYKLIAKDSMQELGIYIFYTTEKGKLYKACMPGFTSDGKVWEKYFEDIHAIEKEEQNFVLKLSYILSKELGYQMYKAANEGKDVSKEAGTYGSDICFPGNTKVSMANGNTKLLSDIKQGDKIITINPSTKKTEITTVEALSIHEAKNYAITHVMLLHVEENNNNIVLSIKQIDATPNHPLLTSTGEKKIGDITEADEVLCYNETTKTYTTYKVWYKKEEAKGVQKVYNIVAAEGSTFIMNDVMLLQKPLKN
jgi:hypothetical protein